MDAQAWLSQGAKFLNEGRLDAARECYVHALELDPDLQPALINLGYVLLELEHFDLAEAPLARALAADASNIDAIFMLGRAVAMRGAAAEAASHFQSVVALQADFAPAYREWSQLLVLQGEVISAASVVEAGLAALPGNADLHFLRGNLYRGTGELERAIERYQEALRLMPGQADVMASLGLALQDMGRLDEARACLRQVLAARPNSSAACQQLGLALQRVGLLDESVRAYQLALEHDPDDAETYSGMGVAHDSRGDLQSAVSCFERVVALRPGSGRALCNLGISRQKLEHFDAAKNCYLQAQKLEPDLAIAHSHLAALLVELGEPVAALAEFKEAAALDPDFLEARSHEIFTLSYNSTPEQYLCAASAFGQRVQASAKPFEQWNVEPTMGGGPQRMKIGLVSGDLRKHPVGYFIEDVLRQLGKHAIDIHCFCTSPHEDELSERLKKHSTSWLNLVGLSDEDAAKAIHKLGVHVLIDLSGHTAHNRLGVFAWRPAPVQLSWLGYFASTGLTCIDYVIADGICVPDAASGHFTEKIWRLPETRLCFSEPTSRAEIPVAALPALRNAYVTFGCFQNLNKINEKVLNLWRAVMEALPDSRLRLQNKQTVRPEQRAALTARLAEAGLDTKRITLSPPSARAQYLLAYNEVDILLDTFPFPGGTTTCEALWMGVPTVTMSGASMLERQGHALLACAGLGDWIAGTEQEYVQLAIAHASNLAALSALRKKLREQVLDSPLFDAEKFAGRLSDALKAIWSEQRGRATGQYGRP